MKYIALLMVGAVAVTGLASASLAQEDPIKARQELMKQNGRDAKAVFEMLQGKAPFDQDKAVAALRSIAEHVGEFPDHFPEGSDQGDTKALPAIWENKADFEARAEKLETDALTLAAAVEAGGEDALKAGAGTVFDSCKACHDQYQRAD